MPLFKLTRADGFALNIPAHSIVTIESMREGKSSAFPDAKCFIRFNLGGGLSAARLSNPFGETWDRLTKEIPGAASWMEFEMFEEGRQDEDHDVIRFASRYVIAFEGLDPEKPEHLGAQTLLTVDFVGGKIDQQGRPVPTLEQFYFFDSPASIEEAMEEGPIPPIPTATIPRQPPRNARRSAPKR